MVWRAESEAMPRLSRGGALCDDCANQANRGMRDMSAIANTRYGRIEGQELDGLLVFKGVPFAAPPTGARRWMPPEEPARWNGVRAAKSFAPIAPQNQPVGGALSFLEALHDPSPQSEDCLYLNIWTPAMDGGRRPVMVWIHGGGFEIGSGSAPVYDGATLARRGDTVIVTFNYRLGPLGFLRLADLTGGRIPATGNEAMLDQIAALAWVRDNIEQFGGDPGNVTIFGESAGGMSAGALCAMENARGLFHKAILQSGACHTAYSVERANRTAEWLVRKLGKSPNDIDGLRAVTPAEILKATFGGTLANPELEMRGLLFEPIIDGKLLPSLPIKRVAGGAIGNVPVLVGTTLEEGKLFTAADPTRASLDEAGLRARVARGLGAELADSVIRAYREARSRRGEPTDAGEMMAAIVTDRMFRMPAVRMAQTQSRMPGRAFNYLFDWKARALGGSLGACHAIELAFVFGTTRLPGMEQFIGEGAEVETLARRTQDAWLAFARTGNPSCESTGEWPAYDEAQRTTMWLGAHFGAQPNARDAERRAWEAVNDEVLGVAF